MTSQVPLKNIPHEHAKLKGKKTNVPKIAPSGLTKEQRSFLMPPMAPRTTAREPLSRVRFQILALGLFIGSLVGVFALQNLLWPKEGIIPYSLFTQTLSWAAWTWVAPFFAVSFGIIGLLFYTPPPKVPQTEEEMPDPITNLVCFRIVSRGQNVDALQKTVDNIRRTMRVYPLFPYRIEVVTDMPVPIDGEDTVHYLVPEKYQTPHESRYKARALHYALWESNIPYNGWILHLDEESQLSPSLVLGMRKAIIEEEASGEHRIGQGTILYHRNFQEHYFLTLADMMRTGDDVGRFQFQHRIPGITWFGMHGSFILVRNSIAQEVGFDLGVEGSVTEDAWWSLLQMDGGRRSRWVDGYVVEQGTASVMDFIKQRKRWFVGLMLTWRLAPAKLRYRLPLMISVVGWSVSWLGVLFTYLNLILGLYVPDMAHLLGNIVFAHYITIYALGLKVNLDDYGPIGKPRALVSYALVILLLPIFSLMESLGVLWGIAKPDLGFHVIKK